MNRKSNNRKSNSRRSNRKQLKRTMRTLLAAYDAENYGVIYDAYETLYENLNWYPHTTEVKTRVPGILDDIIYELYSDIVRKELSETSGLLRRIDMTSESKDGYVTIPKRDMT